MWDVNLFARSAAPQSDVHLKSLPTSWTAHHQTGQYAFCRQHRPSMCVDIGLGEAEDFSALGKFIREDKTFRPRKKFRKRYDRLFEYYKRSYEALKDLYTDMNG